MKGTKLERDFQSGLIKELKAMLPGCIITKLDSGYIQGRSFSRISSRQARTWRNASTAGA